MKMEKADVFIPNPKRSGATLFASGILTKNFEPSDEEGSRLSFLLGPFRLFLYYRLPLRRRAFIVGSGGESPAPLPFVSPEVAVLAEFRGRSIDNLRTAEFALKKSLGIAARLFAMPPLFYAELAALCKSKRYSLEAARALGERFAGRAAI